MHRTAQRVFVISVCILLCPLILAQRVPTAVTIAYLFQQPQELDGKLVRVRARLVFGWEGDNFLYDQPGAVVPKQPSGSAPRLWFHCDLKRERDVCGAIKSGHRPVLGTFTGYFHFVADKESRANGTFDPGPWQLFAVEVSDLRIHDDK